VKADDGPRTRDLRLGKPTYFGLEEPVFARMPPRWPRHPLGPRSSRTAEFCAVARRIVAFLDVLGFKSLVETVEHDTLVEIYRELQAAARLQTTTP
jgi:hypothetical protein